MQHSRSQNIHRPGRVTVVIPAYNAADTLDETLRSVRAQTYRDLEIFVVDDGSTDRTRDIAASHVREDDRVRLIVQTNAGVAHARNNGLMQATGEFFAPVDADDLWKPTKIERQIELLKRSGPGTGLVYTWYASIDEDSRVLGVHKSSEEGEVLSILYRNNFVGNASTPLMRTQGVIDVGGYDASLRARGGQGCEDLKLYIKIAEMSRFAVVKSALTGYRQTRAAMSTQAQQMLRSYDLVMEDCLARCPQFHALVREGRLEVVKYILSRSLRAQRYGASARLYPHLWRCDPRHAFAVTPKLLWQAVPPRVRYSIKAKLGRRPPPQFPPFLDDASFLEEQG